jgi:pyruvate/2-oxoglutarate dehydrogenase complex dihydrolipoamide acyltransferase (E2) component
MTEQMQESQQTQEGQYLQEAQDFFGQSMGRIKGRVQSDNAQLESIMQQLPEESQAQIQEMIDSYSEIEGTMDQAAQDTGVEDAMSQAAQQSDATNAAQQKAQELGVNLSQMQGSGAGGRIIVRDVIGASNQ